MIKKLFLTICIALLAGSIGAQDPADSPRPQRTPHEEAMKQTTRLVRELGIRDSIRFDTLYRMHLKYAILRQKGMTRAQNMDRMVSIQKELERLLTPAEFERFMNHPAEQPRRPRGANVIAPTKPTQPTDSLSTTRP